MSKVPQISKVVRDPEQFVTIMRCVFITLNIGLTVWFLFRPPAFILRINEFVSFEIWTSLSLKANRIFLLAAILVASAGAFFLVRFKARREPDSRYTISWIIDCLAPLGLLAPACVPLLYADMLGPFWRTNLPFFWILALLSLSLTKFLAPALDAPRSTPEYGQRSDRFRAMGIVVMATAVYAFGGYSFSSTVGEHLGDEGHYLLQAQSLYEDRDLDIRNQLMTTLNASDSEELDREKYHVADRSRGDAWHSWHPYGLSLLLAPIWPWEVAGRHFVLAFISGLCLAGLFLVCRRAGCGGTASALVVASLGTSLCWTVYSFRALPEVLGAALLIWTFWAIVAQRQYPWLSAWVATACCVFMPFAQTRFIPLSLMGIGLYGLYGLLGDEKIYPKFFRLTVFTLLCLGGYAAYMVIQLSMFTGASSYPIRDTLFSYPLGAWSALASDRGIISVFPTYIWLLAAVLACLFVEKDNRFLCFGIFSTFLAGLLTANTYAGYAGGSSLPGRYLIAVTPLLFVAAAIMLQKATTVGRFLFFFCSLWSFAILIFILLHLELVGRSFMLPLHRLHSFPLLESLFFPHFSITNLLDYPQILTSLYVFSAIVVTVFVLVFRTANKPVLGLGIVIAALLGIFAANAKNDRAVDYYAYFHALPLESARYLELVDPLKTRPPWDARFDVENFHAFTGVQVGKENSTPMAMRIVRENTHEPGMMAFGRFGTVFPGSYSAAFDLNLNQAGQNLPVARLEVAIDQGKSILAQVDVKEQSSTGIIPLAFNALGFWSVEPRIYYHGVGDLDFRGLVIQEHIPEGGNHLPALIFEHVPMNIVRTVFSPYLSRFHPAASIASEAVNPNGGGH